MFKLDDEEKTGLLGGLVLLGFGIIISLLLAYAHKQSIEQNTTKPAKTVCIQVDQNGNIQEVKKKENCFQYFIGICLIGLMVLAALYLF